MTFENALTEIALWGPPGSGKSWLINAFAHSLRGISDRSNDFNYVLLDQNSELVSGKTPISSATNNIQDIAYIFSRIPKKNTKAHQISASVHRIIIHDDKGVNTLELKISPTQAAMTYSKYLIVLLDPTLLSTLRYSSDRSYEPYAYQDLLHSLLMQMSQKRVVGEKRKLAICITKIDTLASGFRDPYELVEMYFERPMLEIILNYKNIFDINVFSISPAGWIEKDGKKVSNFNPQTGSLLQPEHWVPYNVEAPFFWFFESSERERIRNSGNRLSRFLFAREREAVYIPYPRTYNR